MTAFSGKLACHNVRQVLEVRMHFRADAALRVEVDVFDAVLEFDASSAK